MAADLSRRGRRVPAGTGSHLPVAPRGGSRLVLKSGLRFTGGRAPFRKRRRLSRRKRPGTGCAAIMGDLREKQTKQRAAFYGTGRNWWPFCEIHDGSVEL